MGRIKKEIDKANTPKRVERLLSVCLIRFAEFLNTSSVHAAIDYSGYFINGKFFTNEEMVQEFINEFGNIKSAAEKLADDDWLNLSKPNNDKKLSKTTLASIKETPKPKVGSNKTTSGKTGRGRPSKK